MKIKKFRIRPRFPTVARLLKGLMGVKQLSVDVEQSFQDENDRFLRHAIPTGFYNTWSREELPLALRESLQAANGGKPMAVSAAVATIGAPAEEYLSEILMGGHAQRAQVVTAFCEEAADLSLQFLLRLLTDEAKSDDCDVAEPIVIDQPHVLTDILGLLEAETEGVSVDTAGHLAPRFTRVVLVAWHPIARRKRAAAPVKKRAA